MLKEKLGNQIIVLASKSPRRQELLKELGLDYELRTVENLDESFPANMAGEEIPVFLAKKKALAFIPGLAEKELLITADTIVYLDGRIINKPESREEAIEMLTSLSGKKHQVISGVCITNLNKQVAFSCTTDVFFKVLSPGEIAFYVDSYKPFDKAGAYGIQEWIGFIGIERIEGSYFNVVGLPVQKLYNELLTF